MKYLVIEYEGKLYRISCEREGDLKEIQRMADIGLITLKDGYASEDYNLLTEQEYYNICLAAVRQNGLALKYVKNRTPELELEAGKQNNGDEKLCFANENIDTNNLPLYRWDEITSESALEKVKQNGLALQFVDNQTPELCLEAVRQNGLALKYVNKEIPEISLLMLESRFRVLVAKNEFKELMKTKSFLKVLEGIKNPIEDTKNPPKR